MRLRLPSLGVAATLALSACGSGSAPPSHPASAPRATAAPAGAASRAPFGRPQPVPEAAAKLEPGVPWFLAVGDSITSGFTVDQARAGVNSSWAVQLAGLLATSGRPWRVYDTACPGETTLSYRTGCRDQTAIPLLHGHPQREVALAAIRAHGADLRLVVVDLGSNDLLAGRFRGADPLSVGNGLRARLDSILAELHVAAPGVPLVVANFYDPFENSAASDLAAVGAVNAAVTALATARGFRVADFFSAINHLPPPYPDLCLWVDCKHRDIHPTIAGHARLAAAAYAALG